MPKNNYVVHYRNLQDYLSKASILKQVHRILEFKQSAWMKPYEGLLIDFTSRIHKYFNEQSLFYWKMKGYMTEDEVLGINLVHKDFY